MAGRENAATRHLRAAAARHDTRIPAGRMTAALGMLAPAAAAEASGMALRMLATILAGMPDPPALEAAP